MAILLRLWHLFLTYGIMNIILGLKKKNFPDLQAIEKHYIRTQGAFLVATVEDKIVATVACNKLGARTFVIKRMFVNKQYRGFGVAQSLLNKLFSHIASNEKTNKVSFCLSTKEVDAIAAKALYLKNGFRKVDRSVLPENFPFFEQDDLFMLKEYANDRTEVGT